MNNGDAVPNQFAAAARALAASMRQIFALRAETDHEGTIQQVRSDLEFRSGSTWALVFAILIASVGLNVNSTAVIIGAMLISPLMGPITGVGFGLATNDFTLIRRGLRNLLIAASVGLVVSTLYFLLTPLEGEQSELLARTRPTLYDVLIALFGGSAGVVAVSRTSNKGNVVPGVAIATALMPPLCTAGFGLANGNLWFFLGALHLFLINTLFICLSTLGFARAMQFKRAEELSPTHRLRARSVILVMALAIGVPSIYTGWTVVQEARFQRAARRYVAENLNFSDRAIAGVDLAYSGRGSTISATVLGPRLSEDGVRSLQQRLSSYGLVRTTLVLRQPLNEQVPPERLAQMVREGILGDLYKRNEEALESREERIRTLEDEVVRLRSSQFPLQELSTELAALYPTLVSIAVGSEVTVSGTAADSTPAVVVVAAWRRIPPVGDQERLRVFLALRLRVESLRLVNAAAR